MSLDHLEEERRPVLRRLREDLQQVAVVIAVGEDAQPREVGPALVDLADALAERLEARGIQVRWDDRLPGARRFYASDPWGNRVEFLARE